MQNKSSPTGSEVTTGGSANYDLINDIDVNVFDDNNILVRGQCVTDIHIIQGHEPEENKP